jgi:amino acid transporter
MLGFTASNCIVFAEYVLFASGRPATNADIKLLGAALLTAIVLVHSCFLRTGIFVQNVLGYAKIALVVLMIFAGLFAVIFRIQMDEANTMAFSLEHEMSSSGWSQLWEGSVWSWGVLATALFKVFYSYAGLHNVNNVLNEVKDPVRTLKSAASAALVTACVLYVLINTAYFMVVPLHEIKDSGELIAALFFQRLFGESVGE